VGVLNTNGVGRVIARAGRWLRIIADPRRGDGRGAGPSSEFELLVYSN
jgi:hypothetical protein